MQRLITGSLLIAYVAASANKVFSVVSFGAVGDGVTNNTAAVRAAAAAAGASGNPSVLLIPAGNFVTGSFCLPSHTELRVHGRLIGIWPASSAAAQYDYPLIAGPPSYPQGLMHRALVFSRNTTGVTISGGGVIWGSGDPWWGWAGYAFNRTGGLLCRSSVDCTGTPGAVCQGSTCKAPTDAGLTAARPHTVHLWNTTAVRLSDVTVMRSAFWTIRLTFCAGVVVDRLRVITNDTEAGDAESGQPPARFQPANTDGLDVDSTVNLTVRDSLFACHDDGVVLKSGKDGWGRAVGRPTSNVWIENTVAHSFVGSAFAIGSEMSGGVHNVTVTGFRTEATELALSIKTERGRGGVVSGITFKNVTIVNTGCPAIQLSELYHSGIPRGNASTTPILRNISFEGVVAERIIGHPGFCKPLGFVRSSRVGVKVQQPLALLLGLPESRLQGVALDRVSLSGPSSTGIECADAHIVTSALKVNGRFVPTLKCTGLRTGTDA